MIALFKKFVRPILFWAGKQYCTRTNRWWYESQRFRMINERPIEYAFMFRAIRNLMPKTVLDVGTGDTALPSLIRACCPMVTANGATIVDQEYWQVFTGPLWTFGQRIEKPVSGGPEEVHI